MQFHFSEIFPTTTQEKTGFQNVHKYLLLNGIIKWHLMYKCDQSS